MREVRVGGGELAVAANTYLDTRIHTVRCKLYRLLIFNPQPGPGVKRELFPPNLVVGDVWPLPPGNHYPTKCFDAPPTNEISKQKMKFTTPRMVYPDERTKKLMQRMQWMEVDIVIVFVLICISWDTEKTEKTEFEGRGKQVFFLRYKRTEQKTETERSFLFIYLSHKIQNERKKFFYFISFSKIQIKANETRSRKKRRKKKWIHIPWNKIRLKKKKNKRSRLTKAKKTLERNFYLEPAHIK